jgi:hypothetical protein
MRSVGFARPALTAAVAATLLVALPSRPEAHEIPPTVVVQAFVKPERDTLRMLIRVPLAAMRDMDIPLHGATGYVNLTDFRVDSLLLGAAKIWIADYIKLREGNTDLGPPRIAAYRIALPADRSFETYAGALAGLAGPRFPADTALLFQQALFDVQLEYPIASDQSDFSINPALGQLGLRTTTVLRFLPPGGADRVFQYGGNPGLVRLDPRWHQAVLRFVALGFHHILDGIDHILFVLCLVIPIRRLRPLIAVVTAFTVAHSITLVASAMGLAPDVLWFPPLIETLIAISIVYMAFENIVGAKLERRWMIAFGFGLVHGFGFSFFLRESLQFAGSHLVTSLIAFNIGVEIGQIFVLAIAIPVLGLLYRRVVSERVGTILLSALVAHTAWHWMVDRGSTLAEYDYQWPTLDLALMASAMRWLMLALIVVGAGWALSELFKRMITRDKVGN